MSSVRSVNVYVLQNGKFVPKPPTTHPPLIKTSRSDKHDLHQQSTRRQLDNISDAPVKIIRFGSPDLSSSPGSSRSNYVPKYFTSRKVTADVDPYELSPYKEVNKTPGKNIAMQNKDVKEVYYTPRKNRNQEGENEEEGKGWVGRKEVQEVKRDLGEELKLIQIKNTQKEGEEIGVLSWYQQTLSDRVHQISSLKEELERCQKTISTLTERNEALGRVHHQLCLQLFRLKGQSFQLSDYLRIFKNPSESTVHPILFQSEVERLHSQLLQLKANNTLSPQEIIISGQIKKQLECQQAYLTEYQKGFQKKQVLHKLLSFAVHKQKNIIQAMSAEKIHQVFFQNILETLHNLLIQTKTQVNFKGKRSQDQIEMLLELLKDAERKEQQQRFKTIEFLIQYQKVEVQTKAILSSQLKKQADLLEKQQSKECTASLVSKSKARITQLQQQIQQIRENITKLQSQSVIKPPGIPLIPPSPSKQPTKSPPPSPSPSPPTLPPSSSIQFIRAHSPDKVTFKSPQRPHDSVIPIRSIPKH